MRSFSADGREVVRSCSCSPYAAVCLSSSGRSLHVVPQTRARDAALELKEPSKPPRTLRTRGEIKIQPATASIANEGWASWAREKSETRRASARVGANTSFGKRDSDVDALAPAAAPLARPLHAMTHVFRAIDFALCEPCRAVSPTATSHRPPSSQRLPLPISTRFHGNSHSHARTVAPNAAHAALACLSLPSARLTRAPHIGELCHRTLNSTLEMSPADAEGGSQPIKMAKCSTSYTPPCRHSVRTLLSSARACTRREENLEHLEGSV